VLQRRPTNPVETYDHGGYRRLFRTADGPVVVEVANHGSIDAPDVHVSFVSGEPSDATRRRLAQSIRAMLGLDVDPKPLLRAAARMPRMQRTTRALRGMRPPRFATLFETVTNVIPFQQLSLDAGIAIVTRLVERFGEHVTHDGRRFAAYPLAATIATARLPALLACGLSRAKAAALRGVARAIDAGDLDEDAIGRMQTADALEALLALPGIGPWSAALVLLRGYGRLDVFPPGDSGAKRSLDALLKLRAGETLDGVIERLAEHRGYLYLSALGGGLLAKGLIDSAPPLRVPRQRASSSVLRRERRASG
jgi:DNA-3-methyladenine glycosylase II